METRSNKDKIIFKKKCDFSVAFCLILNRRKYDNEIEIRRNYKKFMLKANKIHYLIILFITFATY